MAAPEVTSTTTSSKSPSSYTPLIQEGSGGLAYAIGVRVPTTRIRRRTTADVDRGQRRSMHLDYNGHRRLSRNALLPPLNARLMPRDGGDAAPRIKARPIQSSSR